VRVAGVIVGLVTVLLAAPAAHAGKGPAFRYTFTGRIGSRGSAPGQFSGTSTTGPGGIAIDQGCGEIFMGDLNRHVVYRYDENGKFLNQIGKPGTAKGELQEPAGIFVDTIGSPLNLNGPPMHCGGYFANTPGVWIADYGDHRIDVFSPTGDLRFMFCNPTPANTDCDVTRGGKEGFDFNPHDVWINGESFYVAGRFGNVVKQYNINGDYVRESDSTMGAAYSVAAQGTQMWSTYSNSNIASYSLDPGNTKMNLVHVFGAGFNSTKPGEFANPKGIWIGYDGKLFVLDETRVQVFSPSFRYLSTITLPKSVRGVDIATRYDGTVYVSDALGYGALVYSPGPIVNLKKVPGARDEIVLSVRVSPGHPGDQILLERIAGNGWRKIAKLRLDQHSSVRYHWNPPRRNHHYEVRASFKDPHPYHADRASAIIDVASK
jgi:hypothetical protein